MNNPFQRHRQSAAGDGALGGTARVDARTKNLTKRLRSGDVAIIDHADIDRVSAEALVACRPAVVLNAARSTTGRYPNLGPQILLDAGIPLVDDLGPDVMGIREGHRVHVNGGEVWDGNRLVAEGTPQDADTIGRSLEEAREGLSLQFEAFAANTASYILKERELLFDGAGVPDVRTDFEGRQVLVVVRGYHYKEDLAMLKSYVREYRPILIGVDGGADAILEAGMKLDMIVGDMDSVSDRALTSGAEIVVHAYRDGRAPGMLLADDKGADLIVAVGTHTTLIEFLDKGRAGMASTFLTRLRVGTKLVDAKGVSQLSRPRITTLQLFLLAVAGLLALLVALLATNFGQALLGLSGAWWDDIVNIVRGLLGMAPSAPTT